MRTVSNPFLNLFCQFFDGILKPLGDPWWPRGTLLGTLGALPGSSGGLFGGAGDLTAGNLIFGTIWVP